MVHIRNTLHKHKYTHGTGGAENRTFVFFLWPSVGQNRYHIDFMLNLSVALHTGHFCDTSDSKTIDEINRRHMSNTNTALHTTVLGFKVHWKSHSEAAVNCASLYIPRLKST